MHMDSMSLLLQKSTVSILLVTAGAGTTLTRAGLTQPLSLAARLSDGRLRLETMRVEDGLALSPGDFDLALLVADESDATPDDAHVSGMIRQLRKCHVWGGVGAAVAWMAAAGGFRNVRVALPWAMEPFDDSLADAVILSPNLFELDRGILTCCGGAASVDLALYLINAFCGPETKSTVMEALCIGQARESSERQRKALHTRFGELQPKLSEAVALMEANIEEPLGTDELAELVGLSVRQLERQFKQYLGNMPSRFYFELRLKKSQRLLRETNQSIVQIGLMCGFSSGAHFSTAYSNFFGITPREERRRRLAAGVGMPDRNLPFRKEAGPDIAASRPLVGPRLEG